MLFAVQHPSALDDRSRNSIGDHSLMPVLSDRWIRQMAQEHGMIEPFVEAQKRDGVISYGLSSYGYDARIADEFKIFTNIDSAVVDPKAFSPASFVDRKMDVCIIPPNSFALGQTVEYFRIPRDVLVICLGKSTYARCGIIVNVTPLEPEWEGKVTIEISNTTPLPAKIYANEGICQFLFLQGTSPARRATPTRRVNIWVSGAPSCRECKKVHGPCLQRPAFVGQNQGRRGHEYRLAATDR